MRSTLEHHLQLLPTSPSDPPAHLELLRVLEEHPEYSQRQIARALGVSLGKTHYLLKALLGKGWVKVQSFQRSANKLGFLYRLTPCGFAHRLHMTQRFLATKEAEYEALYRQIADLRAELSLREAPDAGTAQDQADPGARP